jgi:DNA-binding NtrC family response regulator
VVLSRGEFIEARQLESLDLPALSSGSGDLFVRGRPTLDELEETYISQVLEECGGDKQQAAKLLGISIRTLYRREKR